MAGILPPDYGHRTFRVEVVAMIQPKRIFIRCTELLRFAIVAIMLASPVMAQAGQGPIKPGQQIPPVEAAPPTQATPPAQTTSSAQTAAPAQATQAGSAQPTTTATPAETVQPVAAAKPAMLTVPAGTKLPLVLHNSITTRNAKPGDPVYLETLFPIVINNKILVPAGSYVQGEIISTKRPGKVKGVGEMQIRLNTMILPNGYTVNFNAIPSNAGTGGNESVDGEGKIKGDTDKSTDAGTILKGTAIGAGIGGIASRSAGGAGIGAAAGAVVGLMTVLLTRGPELELPRGTTLDVVIDRAVYLDASFITFTDPGHSSTLPGPANREPTRSRSPF
jgi:type IV secretion system protein VirB10